MPRVKIGRNAFWPNHADQPAEWGGAWLPYWDTNYHFYSDSGYLDGAKGKYGQNLQAVYVTCKAKVVGGDPDDSEYVIGLGADRWLGNWNKKDIMLNRFKRIGSTPKDANGWETFRAHNLSWNQIEALPNWKLPPAH